MGIVEVLGPARDEILRVAAAHGARNVRVFGSVARGDARPDSDVDLLVEFQAQPSLMDHVRFGLDLERVLGRKVDVVTERELRASKREQVLREAIAL
ncbi:MAG: nucleotidyltransferase family protein [Candidatus Coatesbacteria bacterium]